MVQVAGALLFVLIAGTAIFIRAYGQRPTAALSPSVSPSLSATPSATAAESTASPTPTATPTVPDSSPSATPSPTPEPSLPAGWVPHAIDMAIAYDEAHGYTLLLTLELVPPPPGTADGVLRAVSATWKWDGSSWTLLHPAVSPPNMGGPTVTFSNMVYDAALHEVVVMARTGTTSSNKTITTWGWDGVTWKDLQMTPMLSPDAADNYLAFDRAHSQLVLLQSTAYAGTTQTWTGQGSTWTRRTPVTQPTGPPIGGGIAYDPRSSTVLVFGGTDGMGASNVNETWSWDGATWKHFQPVARPAGGYATLAYDAANRQMVLFEAALVPGRSDTRTTSTWTWDGANWTPVPAGGGPAFGGHMAYDPARRELIMVGYTGEMFGVMSTWTYTGGQWQRA